MTSLISAIVLDRVHHVPDETIRMACISPHLVDKEVHDVDDLDPVHIVVWVPTQGDFVFRIIVRDVLQRYNLSLQPEFLGFI